MEKVKIKTSQLPDLEYLNKLFQYNKSTGQLMRKFTINYAAKAGNVVGYIAGNGYKMVSVLNKRLYVHRICWYLATKQEPSGYFIDHINRDRTDNRFQNLRLVGHLMNTRNISMQKNNTSGLTGVYKYGDKRWIACMFLNYKKINLGIFNTKKEARDARAKAVAIYWTD